MTEYFETSPRKGRPPGSITQESRALIQAMYVIAEATRPITGRGVGYKLFTAGLIPSMSTPNMKRVYRLLKLAREEETIPWEWIVDETRGIERVPQWHDPAHFADSVAGQYRRDFWSQQPERCEVWSEKGTVRGVLKPVLDHYGVGFNPVHGFNSATNAHEAASDPDRRPLVVLYVGDYDPSGMCMSERDVPARNRKYKGDHITVKRIALTKAQCRSLPSFPASDKQQDTRYKWFVENYGERCWELDAMDPNRLRDLVRSHVKACILDPEAWSRCERVNKAESESLREVLSAWGRSAGE
jgi:hypothetical protein